MRDVEWVAHKGKFNFKALTPRAREVMGSEVGGPWQMAAEVFFYGVAPDRLEATIARLKAAGLKTDEDNLDEQQLRALTDF